MKEIWKTIEGYTDYQISNYGRVKSLKFNRERILKPCVDSCNYLLIKLYNCEIKQTYNIHRLVAQAFIPNPYNKSQVNHIDGNKLNNHIVNLEWCTISENIKHAYKLGLISKNGEKHHLHKLSENEVLTIHGLYLNGMTQKEIGIIYNVTRTCIEYITNGKRWTHLIL